MADDDDARDREALRGAIPRPESDAADTLLAALHRGRLAESLFGEPEPVKVDRYVLRRELGRGGMGVVFVAEDPLLAVPVALKLLHRGRPGPDASAAESQLQREAQALARVRGDHVVRVYSAGFFMGQPWIAMQLVDGPHLGEWLQARHKAGRPDWREVLARYVEAGRGLQAIHAAGLVHRDFKPQNAVVDADGCVKVLDFGLAVGAGEPSSADAPRLGTHRYAAPEQFLGRDQGPASDQFSFCVALYEALTGAPPFGDAVSTGARLASDPAARPPRPAGELPGWLGAALLRGLATRPEDRHADMTALLHELTRDRRRNLRIAALLGAGVLLGGVLVLVLRVLVADRDGLLAARVPFASGSLARELGDRDAASTALGEALRLARQPDPALAVEILHERVRLELITYHSPRDGWKDLEDAAAILDGLGAYALDERLARLWAEHLDMRGLLRTERLDDELALAEHDAAIAIWRLLPPRADVQRRLYESLHARARVRAALFDLPGAIADDRAALGLAIGLHGRDHPALIDLHVALARALAGHGQTAEARVMARRARELLQVGAGQPAVRSRCELAAITRDLGAPVAAELDARAAADLASDPRERGDCDYLVAMLAVRNQSADADAWLQRAIDDRVGVDGPQAACDRAILQTTLGLLLVGRGDLPGAEAAVRSGAPDGCPAGSLVHWVRARIAEQRGDIGEAEASYVAALAEPSDQHAQQQLAFARLLHRARPGDPRIRLFAGEAAPELASQGYAVEAAEAAALAR